MGQAIRTVDIAQWHPRSGPSGGNLTARRNHLAAFGRIEGNLTQGFSDHRDETKRHVENIKRIFEAIGHEPEEQPNRVLDALVDEHLHDL